jgi:hypothetical protein
MNACEGAAIDLAPVDAGFQEMPRACARAEGCGRG